MTEVCSRITATSRKDTTAPAKRAVTSITWPMWRDVVGADRDDLAGRDRRGRVAPRWTVCRATSWTVRYAAVSQLVTANRCRMIPLPACRSADRRASARPAAAARGVAVGDAVVDRAADHRRHHRLASSSRRCRRPSRRAGCATGRGPATTGTAPASGGPRSRGRRGGAWRTRVQATEPGCRRERTGYRPVGHRRRLAREAVDDLGAGQVGQQAPGQQQLGAAHAGADDRDLDLEHPGVDQQPPRRRAARPG